MCGIAGSVNFNYQTDEVIRVMGHRGPDERDSFQHENVLLQHLRLAIVDISAGQQPMHYLGRYTIIFNGEMYNHLDVRKQLSLQCHTGSDTETILHAWHKEKINSLQRFDGMFTIAMYDQLERQLYLVRDRAGKKPLYYFYDGSKLVFASELNALRTLLPLKADDEKLATYLRIGSHFRQHTPYQHVRELPAGSFLKIDTTTLQLQEQTWWQIGDFYRKPVEQISEQDALQKTDLLIEQAVRRRLESSDLEVGSFLSGGIDSGIVTAMAAGMHNKLKTFTVSFEAAYDEAPLAKMVAEKYRTDHQQINISFDHLLDDVEGIVAQYGEPFFDNSAIPSWYVSKAASEHITVVLNGDGADELFGGYRRQVPFAGYNFYKSPQLVKTMARSAAGILKPGDEKISNYTYFYRLLSLAGKRGFSTYLASWTDIFEGFEQNMLPGNDHYMQDCEALFEKVVREPISGLRQVMWLDFDVSLFGALLTKMDIATMAHSLEGRSPMLSKELLEWMPTVPDKLKIRGRTTKYLLRKLAEKYLPEPLIQQPKRGFEIPLKKWVNNELKDLIFGYLQRTDCYYPALIKKGFVQNVLDGSLRLSDEKRAKMLWALFCLEVWYHKCLKSN